MTDIPLPLPPATLPLPLPPATLPLPLPPATLPLPLPPATLPLPLPPATLPLPPVLDDATLRAFAQRRCLADNFGPLIIAEGDTTVQPEELGVDPCVVLGVDIAHDDFAWLSSSTQKIVLDRIRVTPDVAIAATVLLRSRRSTIATRFSLESATYSLLQSGSAFRSWIAMHETRRPHDVDPDREPLVCERTANELTITLHRPAHGNAVNVALRDALVHALHEALIDEAIQVHLKGSGNHFCTGGDLDTFGSFVDPANAHTVRLQRSPAQMLWQLRDRLTVTVHGFAIGSGFEFACFARRVLITPAARFALPEFELGLIPGAGGTVSIVDRIGASKTLLLFLSGESVDAPTALRWGVADELLTLPTT